MEELGERELLDSVGDATLIVSGTSDKTIFEVPTFFSAVDTVGVSGTFGDERLGTDLVMGVGVAFRVVSGNVVVVVVVEVVVVVVEVAVVGDGVVVDIVVVGLSSLGISPFSAIISVV